MGPYFFLNPKMKSIIFLWFAAFIFASANKSVSAVQFEIQAFTTENEERKERSVLQTRIKMTPVVINTWAFINATSKAWDILINENGTALDAVEHGCTVCEDEQCDGTVGFGGSPDENGETTLDAMIMDGPTHRIGAVAGLRRVKHAISVARKVMEHTEHTLLVGDLATRFALQMGFQEQNLSTDHSLNLLQQWKTNSCQPNFWKNVSPNPTETCGPYTPIETVDNLNQIRSEKHSDQQISHDTIGMIAIDSNKNMASGTSTNGANHKVPGRVGDSPIPGSGSYVDQDIGGAAATGDGDILMRFLPSYAAVELMGLGMTPSTAAKFALEKIARYYPDFNGAVVTLKSSGEFGAACYGFQNFTYSVANQDLGNVQVFSIACMMKPENDM